MHKKVKEALEEIAKFPDDNNEMVTITITKGNLREMLSSCQTCAFVLGMVVATAIIVLAIIVTGAKIVPPH